MKIIDAHTHIFECIAGLGPRGELRAIGGGRARWANGDEIAMIPPELGDRSFSAEALIGLMDENDVEKALLLQGSFYGFQNDYTFEAARRYPERFLPAATLDPFCKQADALLHRFLFEYGCRVVKFELSSGGGLMGYHSDFAIDGEVLSAIFPQVAAAGATLVLDIGSPGMASFQPEAVARIARRHPELRIVLCHLLAPTLKDGNALRKGLEMLALPNVWFDLAAMPWNLEPEAYPYPSGAAYLAAARDIVGAQKLIWGSDVPSTLTKESYPRLVDYIAEGAVFSHSELADVFYNNALRAYLFK